MKEKKYITIGKILSSWGIKGQLKVEPLTDDPQRFKNLQGIFVNNNGEHIFYRVESVIFLKRFFPVIKLEGINSKQEADALRGCYIDIDRKFAVKLPKDHYFICDIIGLDVYSDVNEFIGTIADILHTGANDVYVIKGNDGKEILIPAIKQVVKKIDLKNGVMVIKPLEGML